MSKKSREDIVVAMVEAGGGHKSPAWAIAEGLREYLPESYGIIVTDFIREVGALKTDWRHKKGWNTSLKNPWQTRFFYYVMDTFGWPTRFILSILLFPYCLKAKAWLKKHPPRVFIATHFLTAAGAVFARRWSSELHFPVILYATDPNDINSLWMWKGINCLIVSSERAKQRAIKRRMDPKRIKVFGYPVRPSFFSVMPEKKKVAADLGLNANYLTLLISGGGQGLGKLDSLIFSLIQKDLPINLIVVCGKNTPLLRKLQQLERNKVHTTCLFALGFVTNMDELIHVSDVVALKAGAASTYEALFLKKPVIFYEYVAQNELANIHFVVRNRIGWFAETSTKFVAILELLIEDGTNILPIIARRMKQLGLQNGSYDIARFIRDEFIPQPQHTTGVPSVEMVKILPGDIN